MSEHDQNGTPPRNPWERPAEDAGAESTTGRPEQDSTGSQGSGQHSSSDWTGYPSGGSTDPYGSDPYRSSSTFPQTEHYDQPGSYGAGGYQQQNTYGGASYGGATYGGGAQNPYAQPTDPYAQSAGPADNGYPQNSYSANPYQQPAPYGSAPYGAPYGSYSPYGAAPAPAHPRAVVSLVLGIIGMAACPIVGIIGFFIAMNIRREIDAQPGRYSGRGLATAGFVLGILSMLYTLFIVAMIIIGFLADTNGY